LNPTDNNFSEFNLNVIIVKHGFASAVIDFSKQYGISGGTIIPARGTANNPVLKFLALDEIHKEIVIIIAEREKSYLLLAEINKKFEFFKPNKGICFSMLLDKIFGINNSSINNQTIFEGGDIDMFNSIFVIVDKGKGNIVVDVSSEAGARGATIINARGSGSKDDEKIFGIEIVPEKDMVLIVVRKEITEKVCNAINLKLDIEKPGAGIMFVHEVCRAYGINKPV